MFQGSPQWLHIDFMSPVVIEQLNIKFQGGFAGQHCWVEGAVGENQDMTKITEFYPEDINSLQVSF